MDHCTIPGCEAVTAVAGVASTATPTATGTPTPTDTPTPTSTDEATPTRTPTSGPTFYSVVIDYTYDPLQRLVAADYSTGKFFHYTYDAVGNRLTQDTLAGTNTYLYDIANRLIEVDGVPFTWDAKGNLLSDGEWTYTYDHANRLSSAVRGPSSFSFAYNALGDRLRQTVNGSPTNYTVDLAAGLTQVLSDGTNAYLYGVARIGEHQPGGWQYHLGDAIGSVRQVTDSGSSVASTRAYDPYGVSLASTGVDHSVIGFASEFTDRTGLTYLRARFYDPRQGRFLTEDAWEGDESRALSLNRYLYAIANPIRFSDPTGNFINPTGPQACPAYFFSDGLLPWPGITTQQLVDLCRGFYSPSFWSNFQIAGIGNYDCEVLNRTTWRKPSSAAELFGDYICERGPEHVRFDGRDALSVNLASSVSMDDLRRDYYDTGPIGPKEQRFEGLGDYLTEWRSLETDTGFPVVQLLGSFDFSINPGSGNRVQYTVHNRMDLASGTHFIGRFPPQGQGENPLSLEEVIDSSPGFNTQPAWWVIATYDDDQRGRIVSVLKPRLRSETGPGFGGGNFEQTFSWTEANIACTISRMAWPAYLSLLDIDV